MDYLKLDEKLFSLEEKVRLTARPVIGETTKEDWDEVFEFMKEIKDDFKEIRYPKKIDGDTAWARFNALRTDAFDARNRQCKEKSKEHYKELKNTLYNADYNWRADALAKDVLWGVFKVTVETMKERGILLKEAGAYFKSSKHEMIKEHKAEIHERFVEVIESHDVFWHTVREYGEERAQIREERKQAREEKQEKGRMIKERIEQNLQKNKERLEKAEEFLKRLETQKEDLEDKISDAYSDKYRERHEEWLSEKEDKIREVEKEIEKYNEWIDEGKEKLASWID